MRCSALRVLKGNTLHGLAIMFYPWPPLHSINQCMSIGSHGTRWLHAAKFKGIKPLARSTSLCVHTSDPRESVWLRRPQECVMASAGGAWTFRLLAEIQLAAASGKHMNDCKTCGHGCLQYGTRSQHDHTDMQSHSHAGTRAPMHTGTQTCQ